MRIKGLIGGGIFGLAICGAIARADDAATRPTTQAAATRPDVPALIAGKSAFVAQGSMWTADDHVLAFEIASDSGGGERTSFIDGADRTPIFISDGTRTLVYDLEHERVLLVPGSRGKVALAWRAGDSHPMAFTFGLSQYSKDDKELKDPNSRDRDRASVRLETFPNEARIEDGRLLVSSQNSLNALEFVVGGFRVTSRPPGAWVP